HVCAHKCLRQLTVPRAPAISSHSVSCEARITVRIVALLRRPEQRAASMGPTAACGGKELGAGQGSCMAWWLQSRHNLTWGHGGTQIGESLAIGSSTGVGDPRQTTNRRFCYPGTCRIARK